MKGRYIGDGASGGRTSGSRPSGSRPSGSRPSGGRHTRGHAPSSQAPGRVRIIAGAKRGRYLKVAGTGEVRPTGEKVREAIFDVLGPLEGSAVLDLFAGTGAMGLEALSRGAGSCVFAEQDAAVAGVLRANIALLEYVSASEVMVCDFERALARLVRRRPGFDLLFIDPPYRMLTEIESVLSPLLPSLLAREGVAVVEGDREARVTFGRTPVFERVYGNTRVSMIRE